MDTQFEQDAKQSLPGGQKPFRLRRTLIQAAVVVALLVVSFLVGGLVMGRTPAQSTGSSKTTKIGFENIGELATQTAYCTAVKVQQGDRKVFGLSVPLTKSQKVYSYDVQIKAGLDFGEIKWSLDEEDREITVSLPEVRVLSSEVDWDSFQVYDEDESIFRHFTMEEDNEAQKELIETAQNDAVTNGLLDNARDNAEVMLRSFFGNVYDLDEYSIEFKD